MSHLVFDIETIGKDWSELSKADQTYFLKFAKTEEEKENEKQKLALYAPTNQIVAIAMLNPESGKGQVLYQAPEAKDKAELNFKNEAGIEFKTLTEKEILGTFWEAVKFYRTVVTFNGRKFDAPCLMMRSGMLGVKCTKNIIPYRYSPDLHCDLLDQLTFYGHYRKFTLDLYCRAFGIESPKAQGVDGHDVKPLFKDKKYKDIAEYCLRDVEATAQLYEKWQKYIKI